MVINPSSPNFVLQIACVCPLGDSFLHSGQISHWRFDLDKQVWQTYSPFLPHSTHLTGKIRLKRSTSVTIYQMRVFNKRAKFDYELLENIEAGIELHGSEAKSIRLGRLNISQAFA